MSSEYEFEINEKLFNNKNNKSKQFRVEKKNTMHNALLSLIKQQEAVTEKIKKDYQDEMDEINQQFEMVLSKSQQNDQDMKTSIQELYGEMQGYHKERKQLIQQLVDDMHLKSK
eukprot:NODE_59_length_28102_cov_0.971110.p24 type:complete len:114 gc:universal NODE_59_length_28102_cov_0.971110:7208-6867(-)